MQAHQALVGLSVGLITALLCAAGVFDGVERATIDWRARWFDWRSPPPSDEVVIAGIDDRALREVQGWPWDRVYLAEAVRELARGGASVVALDVLIEEAQGPRVVPGDNPEAPKLGLASGDLALTRAIEAHGRVVAPVRFSAQGMVGTDERANEGANEGATGGAGRADDDRPAARRADEQRRITDEARVRDRHERISAVQFDDALRYKAVHVGHARFPVASVGVPAARLGDVSLDATHADSGVRAIAPVVVSDRVWGNFAIVAACLHQGRALEVRGRGGAYVTLGNAARTADSARASHTPWRLPRTPLTWPRGGRTFAGQFTRDPGTPQEISLAAVLQPVLVARAARSNLLTIVDLLAAGGDVGLDPPGEAASLALSLADGSIDDQGYAAGLERLASLCEPVRAAAKEFLDFAAGADGGSGTIDENGLSAEDQARLALFRSAADTLPRLIAACAEAPAEAAKARALLRPLVDGKLVFIGWTATAAAADTVFTSVHPATPGVYVHAAVANSVLTGFVRSVVPRWVDAGAALVAGVIGTLIGVRLRMAVSPPSIVLLLLAWAGVCGVVLWDFGWMIASCSTPMLTGGAAWLAVTLHRGLFEQRARRRTEEQFRAYVSPEVVDVLVEHPELRSLAPQKRELTVMMADLAGFTALAERLGEERTGRVLARYLGEMTEILLRHGATIDKYLGDGIMAFWGAPIESPPERQARDACAAAARMQARLEEMNQRGELDGAGPLRLRIGVAAGPLMVGDFGCPPRRSSYTVIGDAANLASRLETACKALGAGVLVSRSVRKRADAAAAFEPVGRLRLRGREQPEDVWRLGYQNPNSSAGAPLGEDGRHVQPDPAGAEPAGEPRRTEWTGTLTGQGVRAYQEGRFEAAEGVFRELLRSPDARALAQRYLAGIAAWRARNGKDGESNAVAAGEFDGTIDLSDA